MRSLFKGSKLYIPMLIATAAVSVIGFFLCAAADRYASEAPHFLLTGGFFSLFFLLLGAAVFLCEYFFQGYPEAAFRDKLHNPRIRNTFALFAAASLVGAFLLGGLFQFLYELEPSGKSAKVEAYTFIIDNSGSMSGSDPDNMRFDALNQICENLPSDCPVSVYIFGSETKLVREFATQDDLPVAADESWYEDLGGTNLGDALNVCYQDTAAARDNGSFSGANRIIVLTDGYSSDLGGWFGNKLDNAVDGALDSRCEIFAIGFGAPDRATLEKLAWGTMGEYYDAGDAYHIESSMNSAIKAKTRGRMLMGLRSGRMARSFWYGLMRIVCVAVLGFGVSTLAALLIDYKEIQRLIMIENAVKSFAAALILELFIQSSLGSPFVQLIACLLIGALVLTVSCAPQAAVSGSVAGFPGDPYMSGVTDADSLLAQGRNGKKEQDDFAVKM